MGYKKITDLGKKIIIETCTGNTNLFVGTQKYALQKSNASANASYTAVIYDGATPINTGELYANYLIKYIETYCSQFLLDANIVTAQIYVESKFSPANFKQNNTMGLCGLIDYEFYQYLMDGNDTITNGDISNFTQNLSGDTHNIKSYIPYLNIKVNNDKVYETKSSADDTVLATNNRTILFQNIINNPYLSIYIQCFLLSFYGATNKNLASSSMLNYYLRSNESSESYMELVNKNKKIYGDISLAMNYVDNIFKVLSGNFPNLKYSFGKDYDINFQDRIQLDDRKISANAYERIDKISKEVLLQALPKIPKENVDIYLKTLNDNIENFEINNRVRLSHFFAQIGHESNDLRILTESLNYTATQLTKINPFNKYFKTVSDTVEYVGNPEKIANLGYGGRKDLGNGGIETGDGYKFRGRGAIQNTGRKKYADLAKLMNLDLVNNPDLLTEPKNAMIAAFWEWKLRTLNKYADLDDIRKVSTRINGGNPANGLDDRMIRLRRTKIAFGTA
jgi:putative chitinase